MHYNILLQQRWCIIQHIIVDIEVYYLKLIKVEGHHFITSKNLTNLILDFDLQLAFFPSLTNSTLNVDDDSDSIIKSYINVFKPVLKLY